MSSTETRISIAAELLLKYYPNGLALDDARQFTQFRDYFTDALGDEADCLFTSKVREILEQAGERVGDLILPKKSALNNARSTDVKNDAYYAGVVARILMRFFAIDGFKLDSADDCNKLRTLAGNDLSSWSDQKINAFVYKRVAPFEGVCYPVGKKTIERIKTTFEEIFQSGCKIVYYSAFFNKNEYWLEPNGIFAPRFLKDRMRRFFPKLSYHERYFEETPSELSNLEKIKAEILRVWNPIDEPLINVNELVVRTFTPANELAEALENFGEFTKTGNNWKLARQKDFENESEKGGDPLLVDPFDYLPLSVAAQDDEEERKSSQAEDVLSVDCNFEETQTPEAKEDVAQEEEKEEEYETDDDFDDQTIRLDYSASSSDVSYTRPVACFYRKEKIAGNCYWSKLYAAVVTRLLSDYPKKMQRMVNQSLMSNTKSDFADEKGSADFIRPMKIANNFYIEANCSTFDIITRIKATLELCGVDLDELEIRYKKIESRKNKRKPDVKKRQNSAKKIKSKERSSFALESDVFRLEYPLSKTTFVYTKPVVCYYQKEKIAEYCNWSELYVAFVTRLYREFPEKMRSCLNKSLGSWDKLDFADKKRSARFLQPVKIAKDFYIETHSSAYRIAERIKLALELCGGDLDDLEIWYRKKKSTKNEQAEPESFEEPTPEEKTEEDDSFANAPELCSYQTEEDDDSDWL